MKRIFSAMLAALCVAVFAPVARGSMDADPLIGKVMIDQAEWRAGDDDTIWAWDGEAWLGYDMNRLWLKTEGELADGDTESFEVQALYSRPVSAFWDLQIGWRGDFQPTPDRHWAAVGFKGLAPYFFEIDAALFIGESGRTALRFDAEYELLLTQQLILTPEIEFNIYGKDDERRGIASGFSDLEAGLRLRYEIRREFAPYIGINWETDLGDTRDLTKARGEDPDDLQWLIGLRAWF